MNYEPRIKFCEPRATKPLAESPQKLRSNFEDQVSEIFQISRCRFGETSHESRFGFTLREIVVAIGIMVMVVGFSGVIFQRSIGSYRTAMAQTEIMRKLRVITEQLDSDFRGLRKDAPVFMWFQPDPSGLKNRYDRIMFFADGDFQSIKTSIFGNLARIEYSQAADFATPTVLYFTPNPVLARRQHILTSDLNITDHWPRYPNFNDFGAMDPCIPMLRRVDSYEYDWLSLSQWQEIANDPTNVLTIINVAFGITGDSRPIIDIRNTNTLHLLMTEGVSSFSIQWSYSYTDVSGQTHIYWWPSVDRDGNPLTADNDFGLMSPSAKPFGIYFNTAVPSAAIPGWFTYNGAVYLAGAVPDPGFPRALKFTFTLYDSRGVFPQGQTFTHIVYLGD